MELKVEAKNLEMRDNWQEKIEEEKAKLIRHYANLVLHLRVTIEATPGHNPQTPRHSQRCRRRSSPGCRASMRRYVHADQDCFVRSWPEHLVCRKNRTVLAHMPVCAGPVRGWNRTAQACAQTAGHAAFQRHLAGQAAAAETRHCSHHRHGAAGIDPGGGSGQFRQEPGHKAVIAQ